MTNTIAISLGRELLRTIRPIPCKSQESRERLVTLGGVPKTKICRDCGDDKTLDKFAPLKRAGRRSTICMKCEATPKQERDFCIKCLAVKDITEFGFTKGKKHIRIKTCLVCKGEK
jgi:hypothetical protein